MLGQDGNSCIKYSDRLMILVVLVVLLLLSSNTSTGTPVRMKVVVPCTYIVAAFTPLSLDPKTLNP